MNFEKRFGFFLAKIGSTEPRAEEIASQLAALAARIRGIEQDDISLIRKSYIGDQKGQNAELVWEIRVLGMLDAGALSQGAHVEIDWQPNGSTEMKHIVFDLTQPELDHLFGYSHFA